MIHQRHRQTDGRTEGRTTYDSNTALALRASRGKNGQTTFSGIYDGKPNCREWPLETLLFWQLNAVNPTASVTWIGGRCFCSLRQREELCSTVDGEE